ncbi:MAG: hypothetical protein M0R66_02960 [Candidatus Omnitrophica bacterium]|jgi:hypothetical protein|nr:hypothetical protein [Candidatus Omnitrophota bacterium]
MKEPDDINTIPAPGPFAELPAGMRYSRGNTQVVRIPRADRLPNIDPVPTAAPISVHEHV